MMAWAPVIFLPGGGPLLVAGRTIGTDKGAYGAIRVMINCNQTGEAAGMAAVLALRHQQPVAQVDTNRLRADLAAAGSLII